MKTKTAQHTPGPWKAVVSETSGNSSKVFRWDDAGINEPIATLLGKNKEANARLIAAAPELLESLMELRNQILTLKGEGRIQTINSNERTNMLSAALLQTDKAISKAEGGQS